MQTQIITLEILEQKYKNYESDEKYEIKKYFRLIFN